MFCGRLASCPMQKYYSLRRTMQRRSIVVFKVDCCFFFQYQKFRRTQGASITVSFICSELLMHGCLLLCVPQSWGRVLLVQRWSRHQRHGLFSIEESAGNAASAPSAFGLGWKKFREKRILYVWSIKWSLFVKLFYR